MGLQPDHSKTVRIPVRIHSDGRIEYFYGGSLPSIRDGTIGDLVVPEYSLTEKDEVRLIQKEDVVLLLASGSTIRFAIDGTQTHPSLQKHLRPKLASSGNNKSHAVEVELRGDLELQLRGTKQAILKKVECWIPSLERTAKSLNHAYGLVSEWFETNRISHSGNVFMLGYFKEEKTWIQLNTIRESKGARFELYLTRLGARILERIPEESSKLLRELCGGPLNEPNETLVKFIERNLIDLDYKGKFFERSVDEFKEVVASISGTPSIELRRIVQATLKYIKYSLESEEGLTQFKMVNTISVILEEIKESIQ